LNLPLTFSDSTFEEQLKLIRSVRLARITRTRSVASKGKRKQPVLPRVKKEKKVNFRKLSEEDKMAHINKMLGIET